MPVVKDYSLVADSTKDSPATQKPEDDDLAYIKRAPRTYGRKREEPPVVSDDPDTSFSLSQLLSSSGSRVHKTAPPGLSDSVPPSSPLVDTDDDASEGQDSPSNKQPGKFEFAWKKRLRDEDEDDDEDEADLTKQSDVPKSFSFGNATLLLGDDLNSEAPNMEQPVLPPPSTVDDIFSTNTLSSPAGPKSSPLSRPPQFRLKRNNNIIIEDSDDSDNEPTKGLSTKSLSSSDPSPRNVNLFSNTPNSHNISPSTRPTSDDEELPLNSDMSRKSKPRPATQPLEFSEDLNQSIRQDSAQKNKKKVKVSTKKDQKELVIERGRLAAQTTVEIPRTVNARHTTAGILQQIANSKAPGPSRLPEVLDVDPIAPFSSPPPLGRQTKSRGPSKDEALRRHKYDADLPPVDDDDDLPQVADLRAKKPAPALQNAQLLEAKKRALAAFKQDMTDEDDDDLVIQEKPSGLKVDPASKPRVSQIRKDQNKLAKVHGKKAALEISINTPREVLQDILRSQPDPETFTRVMALIVAQNNAGIKKHKQEEYQRHGGHMKTDTEKTSADILVALKEFAEQGLKAAEAQASAQEMDEDEGTDDEDWKPETRGSASPDPSDHEGDEMDVENDENTPFAEEDTSMAEDDDEIAFVKTKVSRRVLVESDSEGETNDENVPPQPAVCRRPSPSESPAEDEDDKENDSNLMYDSGAVTGTPDGSVPTHRALAIDSDLPPRGLAARGRLLELSVGPKVDRVPFRDLTEESTSGSPIRASQQSQSFEAKLQQASPLPSTLVPEPTFKPVFGVKGKAQAIEGGFGGFSQFSQTGGGPSCGSEDTGLTQQFAAAPLLQPGFTDLFESPSLSERSTRSKEAPLGRLLGPSFSLDLTQDVGLKPAFEHEVNISKLNKAQAIIEQDQEDVVDAAVARLQPKQKKPQLYVNDLGFLTQTRPEVGSPEIYQPSPSQPAQRYRPDPLASPSERQPLRTISVSSLGPDPYSPIGSPAPSPSASGGKRRRLRKGSFSREVPNEDERRPGRNAFDAIMRAAKDAKGKGKEKAAVDKEFMKGFFEDEADESDDDNMFGLGVGRKQKGAAGKDDEEIPGEDLDATLEELVNDEQMDDDTVAAAQVHEKYKEQLELDDQAVQKTVEEVIRGEKRKRTRKGLGIDDSDESDDEDEANRRARRKMNKGRFTGRGDIQDLENKDETRAFTVTYKQDLEDNDDEFKYLQEETQIDALMLPNTATGSRDGDVDMEDPDEESDSGVRRRLVKQQAESDEDDDDFYADENVPPTGGAVSFHELRKEIQEKARSGLLPEEAASNLEDVSWIDKEEEEKEKTSMLKVKRVTVSKKPSAFGPKKALGMLAPEAELELDTSLGPAFNKSMIEKADGRNKQWLDYQNKTKMGGTSRSVGGSAITSHVSTKGVASASKGGPTRKGFATANAAQASSSSRNNNRLKPAPSLLSSGTLDKSRNFGPS